MDGSYIGFRYITYGVAKNIQNPELIIYICKGLYIEIAVHFHVSVDSVERNIRTVVNTIWNHGNRELLNDILGIELTRKPKNSMFIDVLSQYISDYCEKENEELTFQ